MVNRVNDFRMRMEKMVEQELLPRYQALAPREQRLLLFSALFLFLTILLFGIVLPLEDERKAMLENVNALKLQAAEARQLADQLQNGVRAPVVGSIMSEVDRIARSSGVRKFMTRIKPQPGMKGSRNLLLQMKSAPYREMVAFISALTDRGMGLSQLKLQAAGRPGYVHLQAVITGD